MKNFLDPSERDSLKQRHRRERDRRTADRIKAVLLADQGWTYRQIATALFLDEQTTSLHVEEYCTKHKLSLESGGSKSKLNADQTAQIDAHLREHLYLKVQDICAYIAHTYGIFYTIPGMTSWLHEHGFSYKKPKGMPAKADEAQQAEFIKYYEDLLIKTPSQEPILFLDGVHPTMATKVACGWIKKGLDKPILTTGSRTRLNIVGALNLETMAVKIAHYETLDSGSMACYFATLRDEYSQCGTLHVILDNGPYNASVDTKQAAEKYNIKLHFLPPYSPNLNPIERLWKVMNEHVRNNRFFATATEFRKTILGFFQDIWPKIGFSLRDRINDNFQKPAI